MSTTTTVSMADATHTLTLGAAGANETQLVGNVIYVDAQSAGASENLVLPAEADLAGRTLWIVVVGGEGVVVQSDAPATVITLATDEVGFITSDGTTLRGGIAPKVAAAGLTNFVESRETGTEDISIWTPTVAADNISLNLEGGGALMLTNSDGTSTGGDARGANALDLQVSRAASTQVASALRGLLITGVNNTASSAGGSVIGGANCDAGGVNSMIMVCTTGISAIGGTNSVIAGGVLSDIAAGGIRGATVAGYYGAVTVESGVTLGGVAALADHPGTVAFSGNSTTAADTERGRSQGQLLHLDQTTTTASPFTMDSIGTQYSLPALSCVSFTGTISAWDITGVTTLQTASAWKYEICAYDDLSGNAVIGAQTVTAIFDGIGGGGIVAAPVFSVTGSGLVVTLTVDANTTNTTRWSATGFLARASETAGS